MERKDALLTIAREAVSLQGSFRGTLLSLKPLVRERWKLDERISELEEFLDSFTEASLKSDPVLHSRFRDALEEYAASIDHFDRVCDRGTLMHRFGTEYHTRAMRLYRLAATHLPKVFRGLVHIKDRGFPHYLSQSKGDLLALDDELFSLEKEAIVALSQPPRDAEAWNGAVSLENVEMADSNKQTKGKNKTKRGGKNSTSERDIKLYETWKRDGSLYKSMAAFAESHSLHRCTMAKAIKRGEKLKRGVDAAE